MNNTIILQMEKLLYQPLRTYQRNVRRFMPVFLLLFLKAQFVIQVRLVIYFNWLYNKPLLVRPGLLSESFEGLIANF